MIKVQVSERLKEVCPEFTGAVIFATVKNTLYNEDLWTEINQVVQTYKNTHKIEDIKDNSAVKATRLAYKRLGKGQCPLYCVNDN